MVSLPQPDDLTSLVLRTDFSDHAAWERLQTVLGELEEYRNATYVSDPVFAGIAVEALVDVDAAAGDEERLFYLFLADATCLADDELRLLAVDLSDEPGRTFRVLPSWFADVSANLSIANMGFAEFADAADEFATFRGFAEE